MNDTTLFLKIGAVLSAQPKWFQNLCLYANTSYQVGTLYWKINEVLKEYGGSYYHASITFNTPEQKTWFILKWS